MSIDIALVEADGAFWINVSMDGGELKPRGPFTSADEAEAAACRAAATCRALFGGNVHIGAAPAAAAARRRA